MDGVRGVLDILREHNLARGRMRGVFHLLISRSLATVDGTVISTGLTWRQLALALKEARFDKHLVEELGADPETLSPRDRERFWFTAIGMADLGSVETAKQSEWVLKSLKPHGIIAVEPSRDAKKK